MVHSLFTVLLSFSLLLHGTSWATADNSPSYIEYSQVALECLASKDLLDGDDKSNGFTAEPAPALIGAAPFIWCKTQPAKNHTPLCYAIRAPPSA